MVRYGGGSQMPAIRRGKEFEDPEGRPITEPGSYEDMEPRRILEILNETNTVLISHIFRL